MVSLFPSELGVRIEAKGGSVADHVQEGPGGKPADAGRLILLIHGYDNSLEGARRAYAGFEENIREEFPQARALFENTFGFFWPGDKAWPPLLHYLSYPMEIAPAKESGKRLAEYLADLGARAAGTIEVFLIAHSLGNRVVQEMLIELLNLLDRGQLNSRVQIRGICMMAAAVPVAKMDTGGEFHITPKKFRTHVLHSPNDRVLHYAFPPGETFAFDAFWPTAVGRWGGPFGLWPLAQKMMGYGHSDYWKKKETAAPVGRLLGLTVQNAIPENAIVPHFLLDAPKLREVSLSVRGINTRSALG